MASSPSRLRAIEKLRQAEGPLRTSQILAAGVHRRDLYALRDSGIVMMVSRGVYQLAEFPPLSEPDIITVAARVPNGVICLVSALHFYGLTTEISRRISVALLRGAARPKLDWPPLLVYRFSKPMFEQGIETRKFEGVPVRIYAAAKTVADCFRFRNRLGLDVAIEALRAGLAGRLFTPGEIMHYAEICRVKKIVRPFLDAMQ